MTRAKQNLYLSFCRSRLVFGGRNRTIPSRFLSEIKTNLIERLETEKTKKENKWEEKRERRIVADWEVELETKDDFAEIDNW